jgi:hypothetical protein
VPVVLSPVTLDNRADIRLKNIYMLQDVITERELRQRLAA